jgi:hypothetical protein
MNKVGVTLAGEMAQITRAVLRTGHGFTIRIKAQAAKVDRKGPSSTSLTDLG